MNIPEREALEAAFVDYSPLTDYGNPAVIAWEAAIDFIEKQHPQGIYRIDATFKTGVTDNNKKSHKTYKYHAIDYSTMLLFLRECLDKGAKVTIKQISEAEYVKGTR